MHQYGGIKIIKAYPIILTPDEYGYFVTIPDIDRNTQGSDIAESIYMAREALGAWVVCEQDAGRYVPEPSSVEINPSDGDIITYVDIDFENYRQSVDMTAERTNVTLPRYLKRKAEAAGINFSYELQERLKERLELK
ncbi:MAG: type II toxin-antitoxin system HicB family antitoxin [Oscillospiraceae bacterium]|nr:type II toxin-antitoxin system HicB family antitoxin [Oscillospiraceae bacterium]